MSRSVGIVRPSKRIGHLWASVNGSAEPWCGQRGTVRLVARFADATCKRCLALFRVQGGRRS